MPHGTEGSSPLPSADPVAKWLRCWSAKPKSWVRLPPGSLWAVSIMVIISGSDPEDIGSIPIPPVSLYKLIGQTAWLRTMH